MTRARLYLLAEIALCLLCALAPHLLSLWPQDVAIALAYCFSHILYPIIAFLLPLFAARKGASAFLCALPPFLLYPPLWIVLGLNVPALPAILSLILAVVGANAGAEMQKRHKKER